MDSHRPSNRFRVLTLNLWQQYGSWADRRSVLVDGIRSLKPDILGFAESTKRDDYDQPADLVGSEFTIVHSKSRDPNGMGISIASRWKVGEVRELDLNVSPRTAGFPCSTLVAEIHAPAPIGPLLFVNHFPNWQLDAEYERELQAVATARFLEERASQDSLPVVMAGDLDADPEAASIRFWCGRQSLQSMSVCYRDAWASAHPNESGHTFTPENPTAKNEIVKGMKPFRDWPFRRIDYVFVRFGAHGGNALDIVACERIFDQPVNGIWASDHFGLVVDIARPL